MSERITCTVHLPPTLHREVQAAGMKLSNRLWIELLRRRLATGNPIPLESEEWRPGGDPPPLQLPLPLVGG